MRSEKSLRVLASEGALAAYAATASGPERAALTSEAYGVTWPVVFSRLTRKLELRRGHSACATSVRHLTDDCLDRFYDDVEAVVDHLLAQARRPIRDLEGWIASRVTVATVDAHRRRRGERGALQRPRLPARLVAALGGDPWLTVLATEILNWVGIPATAGLGLWPLDAWAERRAAVTGDWQASDTATVAREVETVLAAIRRRPSWYATYVEAPLGRKQAPVAPGPATGTDTVADPRPLALVDRHEAEDAQLVALAQDAVSAVAARVRAGEDVQEVVVDVVRTVFALDTCAAEIDLPPHAAAGGTDRVTALLADQAVVARIVAAVLDILDLGQG